MFGDGGVGVLADRPQPYGAARQGQCEQLPEDRVDQVMVYNCECVYYPSTTNLFASLNIN